MAVQKRRDYDVFDAFERFLTPSFQSFEKSLGDWHPRVDILEKPTAWEIHAELPGVNKDDIQLNVQNGVVNISGTRNQRSVTKEDNYRRVERTYGSFSRSFTMPDNAELASPHLAAKLEDGMLEVTIPKKSEEPSEKKSIPITVGGSASSSGSQ